MGFPRGAAGVEPGRSDAARPGARGSGAPALVAVVAFVALVTAFAALGFAGGAAGAATAPSRRFHVAFGSVAAISGTSMEVQNLTTGQTTVDWTSGTTFSHTVTVGAAALAAGECVTITGPTSKGVVEARSVAIAPAASSGKCTSGVVPGGIVFHSQPAPPQGGGFVHRSSTSTHGRKGSRGTVTAHAPAIAVGKVTDVAGPFVTLRGFSFGGRAVRSKAPTSRTSRASKRAAPKVRTLHVKLGTRTTFSEVEATSAAALTVGDCVASSGTAASNGTITATSVSIVSADGKGCGTPRGAPAGGSGKQVQIGA